MSSALRQLNRPALVGLARALEAQRLEPSLSSAQLDGQVPAELLEGVRAELQEMRSDGMAPPPPRPPPAPVG